MELNNQILSEITVYMKYARYIPDLNRRETWDELVTRNKEMHIKKYPAWKEEIENTYKFVYDKKVSFNLKSSDISDTLKNSDYITLHVPAQKEFVIGKNEIKLMKNGAGLINAARGGVIDENGLIEALDDGKLAFAGIDTFENEPKPSIKLLMHPKVSLTPHIGAATSEAQDRIGIELANQIISLVN